MERKLYEVWQVPPKTSFDKRLPWRVQLHRYVATFSTENAAKKYVYAVQVNRGEIKPA